MKAFILCSLLLETAATSWNKGCSDVRFSLVFVLNISTTLSLFPWLRERVMMRAHHLVLHVRNTCNKIKLHQTYLILLNTKKKETVVMFYDVLLLNITKLCIFYFSLFLINRQFIAQRPSSLFLHCKVNFISILQI